MEKTKCEHETSIRHYGLDPFEIFECTSECKKTFVLYEDNDKITHDLTEEIERLKEVNDRLLQTILTSIELLETGDLKNDENKTN